MMTLMLALLAQFGAPDELAPRLDTLRFHVERLRAVTVRPDAAPERETRLAELAALLERGAETVEQFNELYRAIDTVRTWLLANSLERPSRAEGVFIETDDGWAVKTPALEARLLRDDLSLVVITPEHEWRFEPSDQLDIEFADRTLSLTSAASVSAEAFSPGYASGMTVTFASFPELPGFELRITLNLIGSEMEVELVAHEPSPGLRAVNWPKAVQLPNSESAQSVIPFMQGMLLPGDWPQPFQQSDLVNSRSLYMPWWGQILDGHGVQTVLDTSDDAGAHYRHPAGGPTRISPRWYASLGMLRYLRVARYVFDDDATYVSMAKRYRRYVQERGLFVSLAEKRLRTPALDEVIGRPVIHLGALYHFVPEAALFNRERIEQNHAMNTFDQLIDALRQIKAKGIESAYVHLDGWGFYGYDNGHPDVLPAGEEQGGWEGLRRFADTCEELGYLFAVHDQYRDFYKNAVSFDERLAITRPDGSRPEDSTWCGGPQLFLNPRFAPGYVRRNHDLFAANGVKVRGAYLDVFAVVPLEESAHPSHPITRAECARYRRECFDLLRDRGYVVSSEEPADYLVRSLDLVHHGPYATFPHIGGGEASGVPVPLFNLVYHDSILLPWEMGDDGGWGIPRGEAAWLHCFLNAGLPYVGPGDDEVRINRAKEAAQLAGRVALQEMVNHEFLDASRRRQRATYADGTSVTVDFNTREYRIEYPR